MEVCIIHFLRLWNHNIHLLKLQSQSISTWRLHTRTVQMCEQSFTPTMGVWQLILSDDLLLYWQVFGGQQKEEDSRVGWYREALNTVSNLGICCVAIGYFEISMYLVLLTFVAPSWNGILYQVGTTSYTIWHFTR